MKFLKFTVLDSNPASGLRGKEVEMLFNIVHIVSIKPIRNSGAENLLSGFWIRTTNGKKYRASKIPDELAGAIGAQEQETI